MQLEAKMKQRFSWTTLLLFTACLIHSSLATRSDDGKTCDSNGIVGTFSQEDNVTMESLTITPIEFTKKLEVSISKKDAQDGIQIYVNLDSESTCTGGKLDIVGTATCSFAYTVDGKKLKVNGADVGGFEYEDPYQASFAVDKDGKMTVQTSSGASSQLETKTCLNANDTHTSFQMVFEGNGTAVECGVQFEMKGDYRANELKMDSVTCGLECAGCSDGDPTNPETQTTGAGPQSTTESPTPWLWIGLGIGGGVLLIALIALGIIIYCCCFKKKAGDDDEDVEAAPEESDIQPDASTVTGPGAEPSGAEPAQQNPEDKSESKPEDKPEDKPDDKSEAKSEDE